MKNFYFTLIFLLFSLFVTSQTSTEVGVTEGQLTVSLSGAANYSIPIKVPPGVNGVEPKISLSYSSQSNNGSVGYGWNIGGISTITRIPSTKYHNGNVGTIKYNISDNYALDGQRLIVKNGLQENYGRNGTEYETENFSNIKVTSYGASSSNADIGPDYFVVEYPDGSKAYYGYNTGNSSNSRGTVHYAITYWENPQGLRVTYSYFVHDTAKLNIKSITYGARNENTAINEINFIYKNKFAQELQLIGGQPIRDNLLLTEINTKSSGVGFRNYTMTYDLSSLGYERLKTVTEKSGDNTKNLNPTAFTYVENQSTVAPQIDWVKTSNAGFSGNVLHGDFDGDGEIEFITSTDQYLSLNKIMDDYSVLRLATRANMSLPYSKYAVNILDSNFKISNKQSICTYRWNSDSHAPCYYSFYTYNKDTGSLDLDYQKADSQRTVPFLVGDFNGDYLTDAIDLEEAVNGYRNVNLINLDRRLTSDFVTSAGSIEVGILGNINGPGPITGTNIIKQGDINGDGKNDLIIFRADPYNDITVYTLNNNVFQKIIRWQQNMPIPLEFPIVMGDFNGDGKSDIFLVMLRKILISTGGNYFIEEFLPSSFAIPEYPNVSNLQIFAMDFNGDGKDDILRIEPTSKGFGWYSEQFGYSSKSSSIEINCFYRRGTTPNVWLNHKYSRVLVPYDTADSFPDDDNHFDISLIPLFSRKSKTDSSKMELALLGSKISFFSNNCFSTDQHLLKNITLGNGVKEEITYSPLKSGNGVYEASETQVYPNLSIQISPYFKVVSQIDYPNNWQSKMLFKYFGAITNVEGLGFLGFQATMRTNMHNDSNAPVVSSVSKNDFLLRGANVENYSVVGLALPSSQTPTTFISKSTLGYNSPTDALQSNKVFKLKNTSSIQFDGLTNTGTEITTDFDSYNNPLKVTTLVKDVASIVQTTVTDAVYKDPTVTPYIVGRPKSKIQTVSYNGDVATSEEKYTYNSNQLLSQVEKRADATTNYVTEDNTYDLYGNIISKKITAGSNSRTASWGYDSSGRFLTSKTDIELLPTTFTYYPNGTLKTETNPYGQTSTYEYDSWFRKTKATDYLQNIITYTYTTNIVDNSTVLSAVSSDGTETSEKYDEFGRKINEVVKANVNGYYITKNYTHDIYDRVVAEGVPYKAGSIRHSQTIYDVYGRIIQQISPANLRANITYSGLTSTVDDGSKTKKITKDAIGNVIEVIDSPGGTIKYSYYANGNLKETDLDGIKTKILQDKWGRKTQLEDPSAGIYKYTYNDFNELIKEENNNGITNYQLNSFGRLEEKTILGTTNTDSKTIYSYNSLKQISGIEFTDNWNGGIKTTKTYFYDSLHRNDKITENTPYASFTKAITYDSFGRIGTETSIAATGGKTSSKTLKRTYQNGSLYQILDGTTVLWQKDYIDFNGELGSGTFGNGIILTNKHDGDGYNTINECRVGTTNLLKMENSFDREKGNLKDRKTNLFDYPEEFKYDSLDRLTEIITLEQFLSNTFNTSNVEGYQGENVLAISSSGGALSAQVTNAGGTVKRTLLTGAKLGDAVTLTFDMRRIVGSDSYNVYIQEQDPISLATAKYLKGTITSTSITYSLSHTVTQYTNVILRIEKVNTTSLNVFIIDNVVGKRKIAALQGYDANGRITSNYLGTYNYPSSGKVYQNSSIDISTNALPYYQSKPTQAVTYNAFNSPYQIEDTGVEKVSFNYNDNNDRSTMFYGGVQDKLLRPYRKYYSGDGTMEIKENRTTGALEFITYIGGDAYSAPVVFKSDGGTNQNYLYLHRDYQGSVIAISNQTGAIVEKRLFDSWGNTIKVLDGAGNALTSLILLDRGYTGHEHLQSIGIIHMNGRLYDPKLRRFMQADNNIQDPYNTQNYNRYGYVLNNPLKYTDPSGEFWNVVFGYLFTAYVSGAYASGGELNPAKWNSSAYLNIAAKGASFGASTVATNFTNNYLDNYNKPPELGISAVDVLTFIPKIKENYDNGLNQRVIDIYDFFDEKISSSSYWANTVSDFGNDIKNGRSLFFNASAEYQYELYNNAANMSVYDWAYTAGYSAPDIAASFAVPYAIEGIGTRVGGIGSFIESRAFTLNEGYGVFGKSGQMIGNYKIEALYADTNGGGTIFSIKQGKAGGNTLRWDYGLPHSGTGEIGLHSHFRFNVFGNTYGSSAQYQWYDPYRFWNFKK